MFEWFKRKPGARPGTWSIGPAPEDTVLVVGRYGRQFVGGDGRPLNYPPELAFAWTNKHTPWTNFTTGQLMAWAPDAWMVVDALPTKEAPAAFAHPRAVRGDLGT